MSIHFYGTFKSLGVTEITEVWRQRRTGTQIFFSFFFSLNFIFTRVHISRLVEGRGHLERTEKNYIFSLQNSISFQKSFIELFVKWICSFSSFKE